MHQKKKKARYSRAAQDRLLGRDYTKSKKQTVHPSVLEVCLHISASLSFETVYKMWGEKLVDDFQCSEETQPAGGCEVVLPGMRDVQCYANVSTYVALY